MDIHRCVYGVGMEERVSSAGQGQTNDGPIDHGAVLELDGDRLVGELHEEADELHR